MKRQKREIIEHSTGDMIMIGDILKDDPKVLEELREMRKWMDELLRIPMTRNIKNFRTKWQVLEIEMSEHSKADYEYQNTVAVIISVARRAKTIFDNSSEPARKRQFLNYILQNPTVNGKKLYFSIASPFNLVLELADSPNWLRG